jgi:beta-lactamase superfamily II metal-dependent hydrolase
METTMTWTGAVDFDLVPVWGERGRKDFIRMLGWGDLVEVEKMDEAKNEILVKTFRFVDAKDGSKPQQVTAYITPPAKSGLSVNQIVIPVEDSKVLKVNFVDVQQGDGAVIETPRGKRDHGKVVLVDGGDNQLFARYLAARFRGTSVEEPLDVDCILVSHGDADHFLGLTEIMASEDHATEWKRLFIRPHRVYHNGLVKRPSKINGKAVTETAMFGKTKEVDGRKVIVGLVDDLIEDVDAKEMNVPFKKWRGVLETYRKRYKDVPVEMRHLQEGDDDAFDFLKEDGIQIKVLAPIPTQVDGTAGLRFLGEPPKEKEKDDGSEPHIDLDPTKARNKRFPGYSASHTINGHSVLIRLTYGGFSFLLAGDLNEESELDLIERHADDLRSEVLKVPHHGSADFSGEFLKAVCPVLSVVSSGDESQRKEYIHPRASLLGSLGRHSRLDQPLILVTELVAFFAMKGYVDPERHQADKTGVYLVKNGQVVELKKVGKRFFAFERISYGLVKVRTDGKRLMVYTDSGNVKMKEAYAYALNAKGEPLAAQVRQA